MMTKKLVNLLTANIQNASDEESREILSALESMTGEDLSIVLTKNISVQLH